MGLRTTPSQGPNSLQKPPQLGMGGTQSGPPCGGTEDATLAGSNIEDRTQDKETRLLKDLGSTFRKGEFDALFFSL